MEYNLSCFLWKRSGERGFVGLDSQNYILDTLMYEISSFYGPQRLGYTGQSRYFVRQSLSSLIYQNYEAEQSVRELNGSTRVTRNV